MTHAPTELRCRGWQQEAALRMLENNLHPEVAERPEELVVYGGIGKAARDLSSLATIKRELMRLGDDETLLVQSGKPGAVFETHEAAPRVLIANSNLVGEWANWEHFRELDRAGLMMYGQMTAGSWIYIGTQGILQGTYVFLDAKVEKVRDGGRVVRKALVIAHGVHESGRREILSIDVGEAETEAFWTEFLRGLVKRGLVGVQLAISDAHAGLKAAIAKVLGCAWQRCTVHLLRDCLGHARKDQHGLLAALIRPIFNAENLEQARDRLSEAVAHLDGRLGKVATILEDAEPEILAFYAFPAAHWRKLRSTNPLERFNKEIGRRTDVVGIFPDDQSLVRLAGMLCIEQNDEWLVGRGYLSAESISLVLAGPDDHTNKEINEEVPELQAA